MQYGFGISPKSVFTKPDVLEDIVTYGETLGYDFLTLSDHIVIPKKIESRYPYTITGDFPSAVSGDYLDQITLLSFLAAITKRLRLVLSVMVVPHRNPVLTAKMLVTLDVLSRGRVILGAGTGWMREEFEALGLTFFEERGAVTDEYLRLFKELWTSEDPNFQGQYCAVSNIIFLPKPVQKPHIPIWIGGHSKRSLRRAAELGSAWYPIVANPADPLEPDEVAAEMSVLGDYARSAGRNPEDIDLVIKVSLYDTDQQRIGGKRRRFNGTPEQVVSDIHAYQRIGARGVGFDVRSDSAAEVKEKMDWLAKEIIPKA